MKLSTILLTAATLLTTLTFTLDDASANDRRVRVDKRQKLQKQRIRNGVKSGELTRKETKKLARDQKRIKKMERRFKKDGELSKKESYKLEKAQDRASKSIFKKKHNDRDRDDNKEERIAAARKKAKRIAFARRKQNAEKQSE